MRDNRLKRVILSRFRVRPARKKNIIPEILLSGKWDTIYTGVKFGLENNFILSNEYLNEMRQVFLYIVYREYVREISCSQFKYIIFITSITYLKYGKSIPKRYQRQNREPKLTYRSLNLSSVSHFSFFNFISTNRNFFHDLATMHSTYPLIIFNTQPERIIT